MSRLLRGGWSGIRLLGAWGYHSACIPSFVRVLRLQINNNDAGSSYLYHYPVYIAIQCPPVTALTCVSLVPALCIYVEAMSRAIARLACIPTAASAWIPSIYIYINSTYYMHLLRIYVSPNISPIHTACISCMCMRLRCTHAHQCTVDRLISTHPGRFVTCVKFLRHFFSFSCKN